MACHCREAEAAGRLPSVISMCISLDLAQHRGGLPFEECEWMPLEELRDLVVAEQQLTKTNRFPRTLYGHLRTVTSHALMRETREEAAQAAIDAV